MLDEGLRETSFSAIARSVMISAESSALATERNKSFSAIARSVMISAEKSPNWIGRFGVKFQCYSS